MEPENKEANNFESKADEFFDGVVKETPADPSTETKPEDEEAQPETSGAEPVKTEQVKEVEADDSLTTEERIEKIKEILGEDQEALKIYVEEKGYHTDPAWIKQRELIDKLQREAEAKTTLSEEDRVKIEEADRIRSSPEYIKMSMKAEGYTQEAIDKKLLESGFQAQGKPEDDVNLIIDKLGVNLDNMEPTKRAETRAIIEDVAKIANVIVNDRLGKVLPQKLAPYDESLKTTEKSNNATSMVTAMKETITSEGILDFKKDIEPKLNEYMDANPEAIQPDIKAHFDQIYHTLTVERLKTGNKQQERDVMKGSQRQNISAAGAPGGVPKKTGNFEEDADAFLDTLNVS